jgi:thiamine biosynthesis lipoprotein
MNLSRRHAVFGSAALGLAGFAVASPDVVVSRPATAFGTVVKLTVTAPTRLVAEKAIDAGYAEIRAVEKSFNLFDPTSEISKLNSCGELHSASVLMRDLLAKADQYWRLTDGAFDPTVQPLWLAWRNAGRVPEASALKTAEAQLGWSNVQTDSDRVVLPKHTSITLNGIAQGYAADRVIASLLRSGGTAAVIDTGEIAIDGHNVQQLAVRHPRDETKLLGLLRLRSGFVATSGDYASSFTPDFVHHHIFDPSTGQSPTELAAVTVIAPRCVEADALATAFMVMGEKRARALLDARPDVHAVFVTKAVDVSITNGLRDIFEAA